MTTSRKASEGVPFCGSLKGLVLEERDVISPIDVEWELDEPNLVSVSSLAVRPYWSKPGL